VNLTYWIVVSILIVVALIIIIPPLLRKSEIESADSDQRNINIAKERAKDLKNQLQTGNLSQHQFDEQYAELELTLGDDLDIEQTQIHSASQGRWAIPIIAICIPLFSVPIYYSLGEPDALIKAEIKRPLNATNGKGAQDINTMVMQLAKRLKQDPSNAKDWILLGRSFKYLKQYKLAANSFAKAYAILGDDPEILLPYADSLAMVNNGRISGKPAELVFKALEKSPNDTTALWLAGMAKAEQRDFSQALKYWQKLLGILPKDSDSYKEVEQLIASIQPRTDQLTAEIKKEEILGGNAKPILAAKIQVQVDIAANIKTTLNANDTVFIYAKALTGPPMPLAIIRKKVSDLPLKVTLDDNMAMMPSMKLSNFKAVKVVARVSKSGTAMPQAGDYIGSLALPERSESQNVTIMINEKI